VGALSWYDKIQPGQFYLDGRIAAANVIARTKSADAAITMLDDINDLTIEQQILVIQTEANLLSQAKRHQDAFELMQKAVNNLPNSAELVYDYAMTAERVGKLEIMEEELYKLIKMRPDYAAAYNALGYSYADRNIKLVEAKTLVETALKLSPDDHYIMDSLGWVYFRLGDLPNAVEYLRKAYQIQADPEIAAHLGEALWKHGQQEEAKLIWEQALKAHPENDVLVATAKKFKS
ncbi:MAG: tetratricopeptide repeat protein, partial [Methylophilales bacterium 16-45-7]